jgi:hypothetical protein
VKRVSAQALMLVETMPEREREITETVARLRLVAGSQLARLFFTNSGKAASRERSSRRVLNRLCGQHVLTRLERRIGGVRAGSAGHVYGLGPIGKRLDAFWQGEGLRRVRATNEPGAPFVRHTLAVAEQYVRLVEAERTGNCELLSFESEPACWRAFHGPHGALLTLKPDAYVRLGVGEFEQRSFLEVDCGSEGRGALARKCRAYTSYYQSGQEQAETSIFPRVVWLTTTQARVRLLTEVCAELPAEYWPLFVVGTFDRLLPLVVGEAA